LSLKVASAIVRAANWAMIGLAVIMGAFVWRQATLTPIAPVLGKATLLYHVGVIPPSLLLIHSAVSIWIDPSPQDDLAVKRVTLFRMLMGRIVFTGAM
jgi:hypothetical protein